MVPELLSIHIELGDTNCYLECPLDKRTQACYYTNPLYPTGEFHDVQLAVP